MESLEYFFKQRMLRRIKPDYEKSKKSLEISQKTFDEAKQGLKFKMYKYVLAWAYMAMFHSARAILYHEGIQEKSHYATYFYLKEKYKDKMPKEIINLLNIYRVERHEAMYGLDYFPKKDEAEESIKDAESFIKYIKDILK